MVQNYYLYRKFFGQVDDTGFDMLANYRLTELQPVVEK